ncbi:MAG TPA: hypothetical protein EYP14_08615 [Planctomycetaceae bacterium]|nr:hypothetical protein [Planctomycetaceae bacterium]
MKHNVKVLVVSLIALTLALSTASLSRAGGWRAIGRQAKRIAGQFISEHKGSQDTESRTAPSETDALLRKVNEAIDVTRRRRLRADVHSPWQIFHGMLAYGMSFEIKQGDKLISATKWIAGGVTYDGLPLVEATSDGARFHPYTRPYAFEGHVNQFLAILAACDLPRDFKFQAGDREVTIDDMIRQAQLEVTANQELTWTLWSLSHYLDPDAQWTNRYGEVWSLERLVQLCTLDSLSWLPCGGTHRLYAVTLARNQYLKKHHELHGPWQLADQWIQYYIEMARSMQNSDGSFSNNYFDGAGYTYDVVERLDTSGHTLAWLILALPDERLQEPWLRRAVEAVARDLIATSTEPVECGPLYHATHGLVLYRDRVNAMRNRKSASSGARPRQVAPDAPHDAG